MQFWTQRQLVAYILGLWLIAVSALPTHAANFEYIEGDLFYCKILMTGVIEAGDAEKLRQIIAPIKDVYLGLDNDIPARICLDSPGGSLAEALEMAKIIFGIRGTAVRAGASCESACAIFFMAGSYYPENFEISHVPPDRILHPLGKLGFHSPALLIDTERLYNSDTVELAYVAATKTVAALMENADLYNIPSSLMVRMLQTPASEMFYVDNVGIAAHWRISVAPTKSVYPLTKIAVSNACQSFDGFGRHSLSALDFGSANGVQESSMNMDLSETSGEMYGYRFAAAALCNLNLGQWGEAPSTMWVGSLRMGSDWQKLYNYRFFSADTPISALSLNNDNVEEMVNATALSSPTILTSNGTCFVLKDLTVIENQACISQRETSIEGELTAQTINTFTWPSGSKTIIETNGELGGARHKTTINGTKTIAEELSHIPDEAYQASCQTTRVSNELECPGSCWFNFQSGNRFCFVRRLVD